MPLEEKQEVDEERVPLLFELGNRPAGGRQLDAVDRLTATAGLWDALPPAVRAAGLLRRTHPDAPLGSLAEQAGISRPAMAGRLQRLVEAAQP